MSSGKRTKRSRVERDRDGSLDLELVGGEPTAPDEEEWENMLTYERFGVKDAEGNHHSFCVGQYALILPEGTDPEESSKSLPLCKYWVGKIESIRSRGNNRSQVWAKVQWLWSKSDIQSLQKNLKTDILGKMERVLANHCDFVHTTCFQDHANVIQFDESDGEPYDIGYEDFYYRFTIDISKKEMTPATNCLCGTGYNPDSRQSMHFCPRTSCKRAFHASCLRKKGYIDKEHVLISKRLKRKNASSSAARAVQFERSIFGEMDGDAEEEEELKEESVDSEKTLIPQMGLAAQNQGRIWSRGNGNGSGNENGKRDYDYDIVPADLLALARSPMVRGAGADVPYTVTGNFSSVTQARRLVADILDCGVVPPKWAELLELPVESGEEGEEKDINVNVRAWIVEDEGYLCPKCCGAI